MDAQYRKDPTFPQPRWLTPVTPRWVPAEVRAWVASRPAGDIAPAWQQLPAKRRAQWLAAQAEGRERARQQKQRKRR